MRKETTRGRDVKVVEKAINQNKIESFVGRNLELRHMAYLEMPTVAVPSIAYISLVPVKPEIVGVREVRCVGPRATSDIEDAMNTANIIVGHDRNEFLVGLRSHSEPVDQRPLHRKVDPSHRLYALGYGCSGLPRNMRPKAELITPANGQSTMQF